MMIFEAFIIMYVRGRRKVNYNVVLVYKKDFVCK